MWALRRAPGIAFLAVLPVGCVIAIAILGQTGSARPLDFTSFWESGRAVLHGHSPYPSLASLPAHADRHSFVPFVYPPPAAVAMVPLGLLPFWAACLVWLAVSVAALWAALRVLGVADWRCYGAAFLALPTVSAFGVGAFGPLLALGVALAWRYRDRPAVTGAAVAGVVVAKLFLWPVWVWLVLTRRYRAAAWSAALGAGVTFGAWALIGFHGLRDYVPLLGRMTKLVGANSFSLYALGVPQAACVVAALVLLAAARRRGEEALLVAALAAALVATPILWAHYLVVLVVPLALRSPRFSPVWLVPSVLWLDPSPWSYGHAARILPDLAVVAVVCLAPYARRVSSTSSAWVAGLTSWSTRFRVPSASITNVERVTPM